MVKPSCTHAVDNGLYECQLGVDNTGYERVIGKHGCGTRNDNGERLVDFCLNNNCNIGGNIFPHKNIHKLTWKSPDGRTTNQIDHVIVNNKRRSSLLNVRVYKGTDVNSYHYLLKSTNRLKLRKTPSQNQCKSFPTLDTTWQEKKRQTKNNMEEDNYIRAGGNGFFYGPGSGQREMATNCWCLTSHRGWRG